MRKNHISYSVFFFRLELRSMQSLNHHYGFQLWHRLIFESISPVQFDYYVLKRVFAGQILLAWISCRITFKKLRKQDGIFRKHIKKNRCIYIAEIRHKQWASGSNVIILYRSGAYHNNCAN